MGCGVARTGLLTGLCFALIFSGVAHSATEPEGATPAAAQPTLLDLWFVLQTSGAVYAPYAYIVHQDTRVVQSARKQTLLRELDDLIWRLQTMGNSELAAALDQWRRHIRAVDQYRTPGQWGPAALLSNPRNGVPISAVAALGACRVPSWIEIWSAQGVQRIRWQPAMRLSTLLSDNRGILHGVDADTVVLVTPYGSILQRGIAAWNYQDMPLSPGMRLVVPLPLGGKASTWIQKTLAELLAHWLPGDNCRELKLRHKSTYGGDRHQSLLATRLYAAAHCVGVARGRRGFRSTCAAK